MARPLESSSSLMSESSPSEAIPDPPPSPSVSRLDLIPDYMWEKILERLPVPDYVTFAAVCRHWGSIQSNHRRRHAPSPPPMLDRPWFIPGSLTENAVLCADPFSSSSHRLSIPLPDCSSLERSCYLSLPNGWLLLNDQPVLLNRPPGMVGGAKVFNLTLLNPLNKRHQIKLPKVNCRFLCSAAASCPSSVTVTVLLVVVSGCVTSFKLCWVNADGSGNHPSKWHNLDCDRKDRVGLVCSSPIFWQGKFYCMDKTRRLLAVDPLPEKPRVYNLDMDYNVLQSSDSWFEGHPVECNGRLLFAMEHDFNSWAHNSLHRKFQVFEVDLDEKRWVKVECIGDWALLVYNKFAVCVAAADIGVRKNCIYYPGAQREDDVVLWVEFDMETRMTTEASVCAYDPRTHIMFMPTLYPAF